MPRSIVWEQNSQHLTALVSDPESAAVQDRQRNAVERWNVTRPLMVLSKHPGVASLAGSRDGKVLATVVGREIQLLNPLTQEVSKKYVSKLPLPYVSLNDSGRFLAAGNADWLAEREGRAAGFIQVWDTETDKLICEINDESTTTFVALSLDGSKLMSSSNRGPVRLWKTSNGELLHVFDGVLRGAFSLDGQHIAVAKQGIVTATKRSTLNRSRAESVVASRVARPSPNGLRWCMSFALTVYLLQRIHFENHRQTSFRLLVESWNTPDTRRRSTECRHDHLRRPRLDRLWFHGSQDHTNPKHRPVGSKQPDVSPRLCNLQFMLPEPSQYHHRHVSPPAQDHFQRPTRTGWHDQCGLYSLTSVPRGARTNEQALGVMRHFAKTLERKWLSIFANWQMVARPFLAWRFHRWDDQGWTARRRWAGDRTQNDGTDHNLPGQVCGCQESVHGLVRSSLATRSAHASRPIARKIQGPNRFDPHRKVLGNGRMV